MTTYYPTADDSGRARSRPTHFVLGGGHLGTAIAERLRADGRAVVTVDERRRSTDAGGSTTTEAADAGRPTDATRGSTDVRVSSDGTSVAGDPANVDVLSTSGVDGASTVIVGTRSDARNFLIAQLVRARFDVDRILVLVHDPRRLVPLADAGHEPLCVTSTVSETVTETL
jgi:Trk K+ transport system NAD-binding subunit